jgi:type I restriction enzyme S subunit
MIQTKEVIKTTFQKYSEYKDSGVDWLGEIPEGWEAIRMKFLFRDVSVKNKPDEELLSVTQDKGVVPRTWVENRMVMPSGNLESFKFIEKGDFAISLRSFEGGLEYCHHNGIISPAYTVLKKRKDLLEGYYKYLFKSYSFISEIQTSVVGIREGKNISYPELSYSLLPIPSSSEQTAIANFLDEKTSKIDQAIAQKERVIELLKERKQIIIQNAVTGKTNCLNYDLNDEFENHDLKRKNHDPSKNQKNHSSRPMKDSGVEWIREIPEHWEVVSLKWLSRIYAGGTPDKSNLSYWTNGTIPWISSGEVNQEFITKPTTHISQRGFENSSANWIPRDSLIVALAGQGKTKGMVAYLDIETTGNQSLAAVIPNKNKVSSFFLFYFIRASYKKLRGDAGEGKRDGLNLSILGDLEIAYPKNFDEQQEIKSFIETQSTKIDEAISLQKTQIEKLKEYKATLIDSAVTGKIKVS